MLLLGGQINYATTMRVKKNVELEVQKYIQELLEEGVINIDNELIKYNR
ncbi:MAG: hypothetical protein ACI9YH_005244 [Colwellia sp.]|jgi:hypothetical protein